MPTTRLIRRIVAALAAPWIFASPSASAALPAYEFCAAKLALPTRNNDTFVEPGELNLEQKKRLVACAAEGKDAEGRIAAISRGKGGP